VDRSTNNRQGERARTGTAQNTGTRQSQEIADDSLWPHREGQSTSTEVNEASQSAKPTESGKNVQRTEFGKNQVSKAVKSAVKEDRKDQSSDAAQSRIAESGKNQTSKAAKSDVAETGKNEALEVLRSSLSEDGQSQPSDAVQTEAKEITQSTTSEKPGKLSKKGVDPVETVVKKELETRGSSTGASISPAVIKQEASARVSSQDIKQGLLDVSKDSPKIEILLKDHSGNAEESSRPKMPSLDRRVAAEEHTKARVEPAGRLREEEQDGGFDLSLSFKKCCPADSVIHLGRRTRLLATQCCRSVSGRILTFLVGSGHT
jgi:hypothetical protein